jgi:hypothetical protein
MSNWLFRHVFRHLGAALLLLVLAMLAAHDPGLLIRLTEALASLFWRAAETIATIVYHVAHEGKEANG